MSEVVTEEAIRDVFNEGLDNALSHISQQQLYEEVSNLLLAKNADYGDAWVTHGLVGILIRMSDKTLRLQNIAGREALVNETSRETLIDLLGYAILAVLAHDNS